LLVTNFYTQSLKRNPIVLFSLFLLPLFVGSISESSGITRKPLPNGTYADCGFDFLNRKISITNKLSNGNQIQRSLTEYDKQSNVTQLSEFTHSATADQVTVMLNDKVYRLEKETRTEGSQVTVSDYTHDKANNRSRKSVAINGAAPAISNYLYGTTSDGFNSNQLKSYNRPESGENVSFTYDNNGNRISRTVGSNTDVYSYDDDNRLVSLDLNTSTTANGLYEYLYDHRTRRVLRDEAAASGDTTRLVFSVGLSVQEHNQSGGSYNLSSPAVEYIRGSDYGGGIGGVLYTLRGGNSSFNYYNHRGDVLLKTNDAGAITWQARYEAFGTRTFESGSDQERQRANTKDEDPTGLLNEGMRYRDLEAGVWLTRDPAGFVDGPNVYTYVKQNPWTMYDPHGLWGVGDSNGAFIDSLWNGAASAGHNSLMTLGGIDQKHGVSTRAFGALQVIGGAGEAVLGAAGVIAPEPVTSVAGAAAVAHGADNVSTGLQKVISGKNSNTLTHQVVKAGAIKAGASEETAEAAGFYTDLTLGIASPMKVQAGMMANSGKITQSGISGSSAKDINQYGEDFVKNGVPIEKKSCK